MNLALAFDTSARNRPDKPAMFWGETEFSYATLRQQSLMVAQQLAVQFGVQPGDRVALWLKNRPEFIPALFGVLNTGAVVVPINNFLKPDEVSYIVQDAGANVMITDEELGAHAAALTAACPKLKLLKVEEFRKPAADSSAGSPEFQLSAATESDLAVIIYTSGTTGRPKGAMLSHGNLMHNVESCRRVLETIDQDRFAVLLPMFHSYMLTVGILLPLLVGASLVLVKSVNQPKHILAEVCQRQTTILPAIPQFYRTLAHAPMALTLPFRICVSGAAPLPVQVLKEFEARYKIPLIEGYGLSEASPVVTKNPLRGEHKPGSIGIPIPNVEVSIQDDEGRMLGTNETGELCVRGGNVMMGYWNLPEETAKVMRNGWLLTGDIGYRDADGYYYITDRKKDMLLVNGINVYPREIEEVMYQFAGVKEAAVVGIPDPRKGEQPIAFAAASDGATLDEKAVLQFLKTKLADYKLPRRLVVLPALPRNATGKILKTSLRELWASSHHGT
ncbi:MAG: long-chain fatty acid--CoA ligase [Verrucomicrobiae bacterium]|nr:long-chain fatty acid--CoA ligase [Verrucomicrobiae bacterium]